MYNNYYNIAIGLIGAIIKCIYYVGIKLIYILYSGSDKVSEVYNNDYIIREESSVIH